MLKPTEEEMKEIMSEYRNEVGFTIMIHDNRNKNPKKNNQSMIFKVEIPTDEVEKHKKESIKRGIDKQELLNHIDGILKKCKMNTDKLGNQNLSQHLITNLICYIGFTKSWKTLKMMDFKGVIMNIHKFKNGSRVGECMVLPKETYQSYSQDFYKGLVEEPICQYQNNYGVS